MFIPQLGTCGISGLLTAGSTGTGSGFHDANRMFNLISDWWSSLGRQAQCGEELDTPKMVSGGGGRHFPAQLAVFLSLAGYLCHQSLESSLRHYSRAARDHGQSREHYHFTPTPWDSAKDCMSHMQEGWLWRFWLGESWFLASNRNTRDQTGAHSWLYPAAPARLTVVVMAQMWSGWGEITVTLHADADVCSCFSLQIWKWKIAESAWIFLIGQIPNLHKRPPLHMCSHGALGFTRITRFNPRMRSWDGTAFPKFTDRETKAQASQLAQETKAGNRRWNAVRLSIM